MNMVIKTNQNTVINCLNNSHKGTIANKKQANDVLYALRAMVRTTNNGK